MEFLSLLLLCTAISGAVVEVSSRNYAQPESKSVPFPFGWNKDIDEKLHQKDGYASYFRKGSDGANPPSSISKYLKIMIGESERTQSSGRDAIKFSDKRGRLATLSEDRRSATRESEEAGFALVYTSRPLGDDELFEIIITETDGSMNENWMFFGVTVKNPSDYEEIPDSVTNIMAPSWLLFMTHLFENNGTLLYEIKDSYCPQISQKGDRLGVVKKYNGDIHFYYNGNDLGMAGSVQDKVYAVVDILTDCKTVTIY